MRVETEKQTSDAAFSCDSDNSMLNCSSNLSGKLDIAAKI